MSTVIIEHKEKEERVEFYPGSLYFRKKNPECGVFVFVRVDILETEYLAKLGEDIYWDEPMEAGTTNRDGWKQFVGTLTIEE